MKSFHSNAIPSQKGKTAIVTGSNTGLGFETAKMFAEKEIEVIMACRNKEKAEKAKKEIVKDIPEAQIHIEELDLASISSVRSFSKRITEKYKKLDFLINNAGVMMPPFVTTKDGFELQMGVNFLGHFLLTGLLLNTLNKADHARIVTLSSIAHKSGEIQFDDLHWKKKYSKTKAYGQSKLACLMFAFTLDRKLKKDNHSTISVASHPGVSNTDLARHLPKWLLFLAKPIIPFMTQSPKEGAMPTIRASFDNEVEGGMYIGPQGKKEMKGVPGKAEVASQAKEEKTQIELWKRAEKELNYTFEV